MTWRALYFIPIGVGVAALLAVLLVVGGYRLRRATGEVGEDERVRGLFTFNSAKRRGYKAVLLVLATLLAFVAAARPQFGRGEKLVPRTNLDVVIVLDFSKSMYAQDVKPSRIFRAKLEIERLIKSLRGARFGAVAFAGDAMSFPLTWDGAAIAQFLRRREPNDMPVGGTAIARALSHARDLFARDPHAAKHERVIVLVTDGEDLEGNPVSVAQNIGDGGTTIHVVQIGGRTPERIPVVGNDGSVQGWRTTPDGKPMTTSLTPEGEQQLEEVAKAAKGQLVRAERGATGIDTIATALRNKMVTELSERVEIEYADVFHYPLGLALLLLLVEVFWPEAPLRGFVRPSPPPRRPRLEPRRLGALRPKEGGARG
jgi:Ca-activated chloride channel family protein